MIVLTLQNAKHFYIQDPKVFYIQQFFDRREFNKILTFNVPIVQLLVAVLQMRLLCYLQLIRARLKKIQGFLVLLALFMRLKTIQRLSRLPRPEPTKIKKKIRAIVYKDRKSTIDEVSELSGVLWSTVQCIINDDLQMRRVAAKFVPLLSTAFSITIKLQLTLPSLCVNF